MFVFICRAYNYMLFLHNEMKETMKHKILVILLLCAGMFSNDINGQGVEAVSAYEFVNSIGACVHVQHGQDASRLAPLLRYVGIKNVRDAADRNYDMSGLLLLNRKAGVKVVIGPGSGACHEDMAETLTMARTLHRAGALLAIEGPNEPNNFGGVEYEGVKGGGSATWLPVAKLQRDLYAAVKADPELNKYPVYGISETGAQTDNCGLQFLVIPTGANTLMPDGTRFADYANIHNYIYHPAWPNAPHDNQVWDAADPGADCHADGVYGNCGKTWVKKFDGYSLDDLETLPRVTTETGAVVGSFDGKITEHVQGCNFMNLFLAQYMRGWNKTFIYELIDDPDGAFGFYGADYTTKRKSADYMHNFTTLLADLKPLKLTRRLDYKFAGPLPETVHDLLIAKNDGSFWLVVWGEKVSGSDKVDVLLPRSVRNVEIYDPTVGITPLYKFKGSETQTVSLDISDHPILLRIK